VSRAPRLARVPAVAVLLALVAAACASSPLASSGPTPGSGSTDKVFLKPYRTTGPFVVVAVDNHFHDIHPIDRTHISTNRPFVVKNEGSNLHNFTVVGTGISVDIPPGKAMRWPVLGDRLKPGTYRVVCKYHSYVGMGGLFVVTPLRT
jgi:Cupredoxin-like domain